MTTKTINIPKEFSLQVKDDIELKDNGPEAKSAPIVMLARTKKKVSYRFSFDEEPIDIIHDFSGMQHKNRIPIDWAHNSNEVIGYINKFNITEEGLVLAGAITPFGTDKGAEVVHKYKQGVPYQASIMTGQGGEVEFVEAGNAAEVNGEAVAGPVLIFREWELTGVAVVRHGADNMTNVIMSKKKEGITQDFIEIELIDKNKGELPMENDNVEAVEAVDTEQELSAEQAEETPVETSEEVVEAAETPEAEAVAEAVEGEEVESEETEADVEAEEESDVEAKDEESIVTPEDAVEESAEESEEAKPVAMTGKDYMNQFGREQGAIYFAEGLSMEEAYKEHIAYLNTELEQAKEVADKASFTRGNEAVELSAENNVDDNTLTSLEDFFKPAK